MKYFESEESFENFQRPLVEHLRGRRLCVKLPTVVNAAGSAVGSMIIRLKESEPLPTGYRTDFCPKKVCQTHFWAYIWQICAWHSDGHTFHAPVARRRKST